MLLRVRATADLQRDGGGLCESAAPPTCRGFQSNGNSNKSGIFNGNSIWPREKECLKQHAWFCSTCWWGGVSNPTLLRLGGSAELQGTCFDTFFNLQVQCVPNPPHVQVKTRSKTLPQRVGGSAELQGGWVAYPPAPASQKHYFFA